MASSLNPWLFVKRLTAARLAALVAIILIIIVTEIPIVATAAAVDDSSPEIKKLIGEANGFIVKGRSSYRDAVAKFTEALSLFPRSTKALAGRGEIYFMLKEWTSASQDFDKLLEIEPLHKKALETRTKLRAATGDLLGASRDQRNLASFFRSQKNDKKANEAQQQSDRLTQLGHSWEQVQQQIAAAATRDASDRINANRHCVSVLKDIITDFAKDNMAMRLRRAECAVAARDHTAVREEIKLIHVREPNNLKAIVISARSFRTLGALDQARSEVKRCLSLDPEYQECLQLHKGLKSYQKKTEGIEKHVKESEWNQALALVDDILATEVDPPNLEQLWRWRCEIFVGLRDVPRGVDACTKSVDLESGNDDKNPQILDSLLRRADLHIMNDDFDKAGADIQKAADVNGNSDRVREYQQKLEKLRQMGNRKDYYKILGVGKTATDAEIRRRYRKLALDLHPDVLRSQDISDADREKYDKQYRDINEAKEMLLNTEKRQRYDAGEDVTKPPGQQQQHHGFHGFPGGFPGFGGGGGGFQFHFG